MTQKVFILSTGRTGTQFLASFFEELGAVSLHEPGPFWLRNVSNAYVTGHLSDKRAKDIFTRTRSSLTTLGNPYVESSCLVYGLAGPLLQAMPEAQIVHIVRDPRTYVRSAMNWGVHRPGGRPLNLLPFRRLAPPQLHPLSIRERIDWARANQFERICWGWTHMNRAIRKQGAGSDRFVTLRFEDVFDREGGSPGLLEICQRVGVQPSEEVLRSLTSKPINETAVKRFPPWTDWSPEMQQTLLEICGDEAALYGYILDA